MQKSMIVVVGLLIGMLAAGSAARADTLVLKNGSTVEGSVIKFGKEYRVKTADGQTRVFDESQVASVRSGNGSTTAPAGSTPVRGSVSFSTTKSRADAVEVPVVAVNLWEKFIDANPTSTDLPIAKTELEKWQKLHQDNAEKINGKWVGGADRDKLLSDYEKLCTQARSEMENQTLQAIDKYEKAQKLYPNGFEANFALGYFYLSKGAGSRGSRGNPQELDKAIKSLEASVKLRPDSPSALSNLAVGYSIRLRWEDSATAAFKAAKIQDSKPVVENLVNCIARMPPVVRNNNQRIRAMLDETNLLARKYSISPDGTGLFHYIPPEKPGTLKPSEVAAKGRPGIIGNGSGFLISSDGYIITNRHVVNDKNRLFRVRFDDGKEQNAEVVAIDTVNDIALIKIKAASPLPYLKIAASNLPNPAAKCMVLGYPIASLLDFKMQVTSGEVTSTNEKDEYQVTLTANTTHGNSGGPIVDRDGNVIGVLSAGETAYNATYLKALSAGQIKSFLSRIKDKFGKTLETGASTDVTFDGEKLAKETRRATVMVLIIRGDGKDADD